MSKKWTSNEQEMSKKWARNLQDERYVQENSFKGVRNEEKMSTT